MRALLTLLLLAAVVVAVLILTDVINIRQTREGALPTVEQGALPEFDVDTADIDIGTERRTVDVPRVEIHGAGENAETDQTAAEPAQ